MRVLAAELQAVDMERPVKSWRDPVFSESVLLRVRGEQDGTVVEVGFIDG
jgi:hypothetical protein